MTIAAIPVHLHPTVSQALLRVRVHGLRPHQILCETGRRLSLGQHLPARDLEMRLRRAFMS